jgi:hypothetical protein
MTSAAVVGAERDAAAHWTHSSSLLPVRFFSTSSASYANRAAHVRPRGPAMDERRALAPAKTATKRNTIAEAKLTQSVRITQPASSPDRSRSASEGAQARAAPSGDGTARGQRRRSVGKKKRGRSPARASLRPPEDRGEQRLLVSLPGSRHGPTTGTFATVHFASPPPADAGVPGLQLRRDDMTAAPVPQQPSRVGLTTGRS